MKKFVTLLRLSLMMAIAGCSSQTTAPEGEVSYPNIADGTYEDVGSDYAGDIKVSVEFKDGEITAINVVESSETLADGVDQMRRIFWIMAWKQMPFLGQLDHQKGFVQQ